MQEVGIAQSVLLLLDWVLDTACLLVVADAMGVCTTEVAPWPFVYALQCA